MGVSPTSSAEHSTGGTRFVVGTAALHLPQLAAQYSIGLEYPEALEAAEPMAADGVGRIQLPLAAGLLDNVADLGTSP
jgi:hypothetical protein